MLNYVRDAGRSTWTSTAAVPHYDSHLYMGDMNATTNADFEIILRVFIKPGATGTDIIDSVAADNVTHYKHNSVAWGTGELEKFRTQYKKVAESGWTNKCWLVPPVDYMELDFPFYGSVYPPKTKFHQCNLRCRLVLDMVSDANDAHVVIEAMKYTPKTGVGGPRANSERLYKEDKPKGASSLSNSTTVDNAGKKHEFNTVIHEVGHNLGEPHIGVTVGSKVATTPGAAVCTIATQNMTNCYSGSNFTESDMRMGMGLKFHTSDANPWLNRVEKHTGIPKARWTVKLTRPAPRPR